MNAETIRQNYRDPKMGLMSLAKFTQKMKKLDPSLTQATIKKALAEEESTEISFEKHDKPEEDHHIQTSAVRNIYQADLMDMSKWAWHNHHYSWILTCIDVYSRKGWMIPIKNKTAPDAKVGFEIIFRDGIPRNLTTDNGKEFLNYQVQGLLQQHNIKHWTAEKGDHNRLGMIERFNRTIRTITGKLMVINHNLKWFDHLEDICENYNTTVHRMTGQTPNDIWNALEPGKTMDEKEEAKDTDLKVGDIVRYRIKKGQFEKNFLERWSRERYVIVKMDGMKYILGEVDNPEKLLEGRFHRKNLRKSVASSKGEDIKEELEDPEQGDERAQLASREGTGEEKPEPQSEGPKFRSLRKGETLIPLYIKDRQLTKERQTKRALKRDDMKESNIIQGEGRSLRSRKPK